MLNEQQQQAKALYFQTNLSKTQIAEIINVSRRSLHYWIRQNNWDRLKVCASQMPALIAEDCYHVMANFSKHLLSESRVMRPITYQEADTLHKLTLTINKLRSRSTLNESMEMFGYFMESVNKKSPELAKAISPIVEEYISSRASVYRSDFLPEGFTDQGLLPKEKEDTEELKLDFQDIVEWSDAERPLIDVEDLRAMDELYPTSRSTAPAAPKAHPSPAPQSDATPGSSPSPLPITDTDTFAPPPPTAQLNEQIHPDQPISNNNITTATPSIRAQILEAA